MRELLKLAQSVMREERWHEAIRLRKEHSAVVETHWELSWNLGWCYFKLKRMDEARKHLARAANIAPENHVCKYGLGQVYLKKKQYKKAEAILSEALRLKESHLSRSSLAFAYLAQGKIEEAEKTHLDGIKLKPRKSERYQSYAAFLSDVGRDAEAEKMGRKAKELQHIN
jgi:tetratricopeptide (TPR) repeat protein